jgi:glutamine synthetase
MTMTDASNPPTGTPHERLARDGVELVAATFVDNAGITRAKLVPAARFAAAERAGIGASTVFAVFTGTDTLAPVGDLDVPTGDFRLVPDTEALIVDASGWAWAPADIHDQEGDPWPFCARGFLRRMLRAASQRQYQLRMAYETEWTAYADTGAPVHAGPGYSLIAAGAARTHLDAVARRLRQLNVPVDQMHAEYSPGQLEVSVAATDPLAACDRVVVVRDVIRMVARELGQRVSFAPLTSVDGLGNGAHLHVSLWRDNENLFGSDTAHRDGLTATGRAFLAGVVRELPALVTVGCASPVSYQRIRPSAWTGAYRCWGVENREAPIRVIRGTYTTRPGGANAELKPIDASGNPYLVAGALIAAGLAGIDDGLDLPPETVIDPATLTPVQRDELGIDPLPMTMPEAIDALRGSIVLRDAFGGELHDALVGVREREHADASPRTVAALIDYYRHRY